jgi:hypothetical protein
MKKALSLFVILAFFYFSPSFASSLQQQRIHAIKQYLNNLQSKDVQGMLTLFTKDGTVVSTSKGKISAQKFFTGFLSELTDATVNLSQLFISIQNNNRLSARFHLTYKLKSGEEGQGEYMDDFTFLDHSSKLSQVYMFENVKL